MIKPAYKSLALTLLLTDQSTNYRLVGFVNPRSRPISFNPDSDFIGLLRLGIDNSDIGNGNASFLLYDATLTADIRIRLSMPLHHVYAGYQCTATVKNPGDLAAFALVATSSHDHFVIPLELLHLTNLNLFTIRPALQSSEPNPNHKYAYSTSGASEMILMNFSLRNSRVTGPKTRVPIGASWLFNKIAALSSKRIREPS